MQDGAVKAGLLGRLLPCNRYRESLTRRVLRGELTSLRQALHDQSQQGDLETLAIQRAPDFKVGDGSRFQLEAFTRMIGEVVAKGCHVVLIKGYVHPALERHMSQSVREDMDRFLSDLAREFPDRLTILPGKDLLMPEAESFEDFVHFTTEAQIWFSQSLATRLKKRSIP